MKHPFELELSDLEVLEPITSEEQVALSGAKGSSASFTKALFEHGGPIVTTLALGEEGGGPDYPEPEPPKPGDLCGPIKPRPPICRPFPTKPPIATTRALGEEGGGCFPPIAYR